MGAHHVTRDDQAEAGSALAGRAREGLEQALPCRPGKAGAVVDHVDGACARRVLDTHEAYPAGTGLEGVAAEIGEDAVELVAIRLDDDVAGELVRQMRSGAGATLLEIGCASCRDRVCPYLSI